MSFVSQSEKSFSLIKITSVFDELIIVSRKLKVITLLTLKRRQTIKLIEQSV